MLTGLLAVLLAGHVVGSIASESARGHPRYDRDYYGYGENSGYGSYQSYSNCVAYRGYADCGYYGYRPYGYRRYEYGYRGYDYGDYGE